MVRDRPPVPRDGGPEGVGGGTDERGLDAAGLIRFPGTDDERGRLGHPDPERVAADAVEGPARVAGSPQAPDVSARARSVRTPQREGLTRTDGDRAAVTTRAWPCSGGRWSPWSRRASRTWGRGWCRTRSWAMTCGTRRFDTRHGSSGGLAARRAPGERPVLRGRRCWKLRERLPRDPNERTRMVPRTVTRTSTGRPRRSGTARRLPGARWAAQRRGRSAHGRGPPLVRSRGLSSTKEHGAGTGGQRAG